MWPVCWVDVEPDDVTATFLGLSAIYRDDDVDVDVFSSQPNVHLRNCYLLYNTILEFKFRHE